MLNNIYKKKQILKPKHQPKLHQSKSVGISLSNNKNNNNKNKNNNKKIIKRSFCFYVRASHLFIGDGWKYLHTMLLDKFPTSSVVFTAREEGISITNRSFYTFENRDIQNDISHLDLLHHVVEATKSPLWYGELKANRKINKSSSINNYGNDEEQLIYYDGGVLIIIRMENWSIFRKIKSIFL